MFKQIIKSALRNLIKNKAFTLINIVGLCIAFAAVIIIAGYIRYEKSYDRFFTNYNRVVRFTIEHRWDKQETHFAKVSMEVALKIESFLDFSLFIVINLSSYS